MNKDISNIVLELCEAVEVYRPLSDAEQQFRARALGVRIGAWTVCDDQELVWAVSQGHKRKDIAAALDRTDMAVRKRIQSLRRSGRITEVAA